MVPSIRFKGFSGDWEKKKLSQCVTEVKRVDENSIAPVMMISASGGFINQSERYSFNNAGKSLKKYTLIKKGELAYNHGASKLRPYGSCFTLIDKEQARIPFVYHCFSVNDNNSVYMATLLNSKSVERQLKRIVSSGVRMDGLLNISFDEYTSIPITLPDIEEQSRIADLITKLDNLITLHQRKLDQLKTLKKYFLQNMFPAKGEKVPKIRMKGFTGDWKEQKINNVIEVYTKKTTIEDQYPVLTSSQQKGIILQNKYFSGEWVSKNGNVGYFIIPRGYFAYRSRSDNDVFVFNRNDAVDIGIISYFYPVFKPKGVDSNFLLERLNYGIEKQIMLNSEGTGQHVLSLKKFKNISALFPSYEEQKLIGCYFQRIEKIIEIYQCKLDEICTLKKYMIQNMFI